MFSAMHAPPLAVRPLTVRPLSVMKPLPLRGCDSCKVPYFECATVLDASFIMRVQPASHPLEP